MACGTGINLKAFEEFMGTGIFVKVEAFDNENK